MIKKLHNERSLALFMITLSALLSTFLTNDIALFIVVPLSLSLQKVIKNDITKLIIFEAIAVNVGSFLTPIGNPQNIFLWHKWGVTTTEFIFKTLPGVLILYGILILFALPVFGKKEIRPFDTNGRHENLNRRLFLSSLVLLAVFVVTLELKQVLYILPFVLLFYLLFYRRVLLRVDWLLLLLFVIIFIDFHVISTLPLIVEKMKYLNLTSGSDVFLFSGVVSQFISNVPASVFVSKFSNDWYAVVYGVNTGGNGIAFASLANLIALRMAGNKKIWITFHKYSIPYMVVSGLAVYLLFFY
jgi:Na+/H+ antiporter NhaD/arsenite permease-like protein